MCQRSVNIIEPTEDDYCNYLDEIYPPYVLGQLIFNASHILLELDPIAFNEGYYEYAIENQRYECVNCGKVYDDEDDALHCSCYDEDTEDEDE